MPNNPTMASDGASILNLDVEAEDLSDEHLVLLAQAGDDSALGNLVERYRPRAKSKARSYFLMGADREDVIQESLIGLYKAIRDFKPQMEVSFRAFAELCMRSQVITAIKGATRNKHAPLNESTSIYWSDDDSVTCLLDRVPMSDAAEDPVRRIIDAEEEDFLATLLDDLLSPLERAVIDLLLAGKSYSDIALALERSVKSIDNAAQRIRVKLNRSIRARGLDDEPEVSLAN